VQLDASLGANARGPRHRGAPAALAVERGADGIIVSNHGGRGEDSGRGTIDVLPEVVGAVKGRIPVLIDSGFRRGTDVVKALAMDATGCCIGRPYLWGLGAFGQPGVERVLELLRIETRAAMQQCGVRAIKGARSEFRAAGVKANIRSPIGASFTVNGTRRDLQLHHRPRTSREDWAV
jgi:isopentenyl diphosphate isomerase/L-lactate dehydrogenase-like FMN-dependent dehydrogenase